MPKIRLPLISVLFFLTAFFDKSGETSATLLAALLHELGHMTVILSLGIGIREIRILPYGFEIYTARAYRSFSEEIAVSLAGCAVNLITFAALIGFGGYAEMLASASLALGLLNIMPIVGLDGGAVLLSVISNFALPDITEKICRTVSFFALIALWIPAAYVFLATGYNYSLFVMCVWLFCKVFCRPTRS